jgi:aminopeptidase N
MAKSVKHLIDQFDPQNYQIRLDIDKKNNLVNGELTVSGKKVGRPSKRITFHQSNLKITDAEIYNVKFDKQIKVSRINLQNNLHEVRLHSDEMIYPGQYEVKLKFTAKISKEMLGIYKSTFTDKGKEKSLIATQFESHHARKAFPCIDEPSAKATFDLTLVTDKTDVVLSNTEELSSKVIKNRKVTSFKTTPKMSTYLLAFVTGEMNFVEAKASDGTLIRSWACSARDKTHLQYSVDEGVKILDFFSDYFQVPFPLEKLDMVALPDFDAGAMENWGLITYREIVLLADPKNRSISSEQYVSLVIAHEISHQWFGNLVTMKWWDDLWLNESFASIMEHIALDNIHPEWNQWELYTSQDVLSTSSRDVYKDIQPVTVKVNDPELIETLFDPGIVYAKGGRLLKMLREYVGDSDFRIGLKKYFEKFAYSNATRNDLWDSLGSVTKHNVPALMDAWITQPGMPVLHVSESDDGLLIKQHRFLLDDGIKDTTLWPIPLLANTSVHPKIMKTAELTVDGDVNTLFNTHGSGHYFVDYLSQAHKQTVAKALHDDSMPAEGRINTLNDLFMLARRGDNSIVDGLKIVVANQPEMRDSVWSLMLRIIGAAHQLTEGDESSEKRLKKLKINLAISHIEQLGWHDKKLDDANIKQFRRTLIAIMVGSDDNKSLKQAVAIYNSKKIDDIPSEIRSVILSAAVREVGLKTINDLVGKYEHASPDLQMDIVSALASTRNPEHANMVISKALGENGFVRAQDLSRWIVLFLRNYYSREVMWQFCVDNWDWIEKVIGDSKSFDYLPTYFASVVTTDNQKKKFENIFMPMIENKVLKHNIEIGLSDIQSRIAWRKRDEPKIKKYLQEIQ